MRRLRLFFQSILALKYLPEASLSAPDQSNFRRTIAYALSFVMLVCLSSSALLNCYEGRFEVALVLVLVALVPVVCLFFLRKNARVTAVLFCLTGTLTLLGGYLLLRGNATEHGSLLWFIIFPPMVMLSLGLRYGSFMFAGFYCFLLLLLGTSLDRFLVQPLTHTEKIRFLMVMFGSFFFSWSAEYIRHYTHLALVQAMNRFEREALTDALTGLGNRRDFDKHYLQTLAKSARDGEAFSLALIDIDHFKKINDVYGHEIGDKVLRHIAEHLGAQIRAMDRLFRWGGEEFILLMPADATFEARLAAERMRRHVEETPYTGNGLHIACTISIGLYTGREAVDYNKPLQETDRNLYEAKKSGRNKVVG